MRGRMREGGSAMSELGAGDDRVLSRLDSYPYRHRVRDVMSAPIRNIAPDASLQEALKAMVAARISSLFVASATDEAPPSASAGIVTERDMMRALAADGPGALECPVSSVMSTPVSTVASDDFVYRAIGRMARLNVRHLGVTDEVGRLIGALTSRDLLKLRSGGAIALGDEIDAAEDEVALSRAFAKLPALATGLLDEDVPIGDIAEVIAREIGALTQRAAAIAQTRMIADGLGPPPCRFAVLVLGSAGRGESLLAADQDNALIFEHGQPGGVEDAWFAKLGERMATILDAAGLPLCKGGVMASNPAFRGSPDTWRDRVDGWIRRSDPADLLSVDIAFDLRAVQGDAALVHQLTADMVARARGSLAFLKLLVAELDDFSPPLTLFGRLRTRDGRLDVKIGGLMAIVAAARVLAIRHGILERGTRARISRLQEEGIGASAELSAIVEAYDVLQSLVLAQQLADIGAGLSPGSRIEPARLSTRKRKELREALARLTNIPMLTRDLLI
jgi:CBS domain-containing protein